MSSQNPTWARAYTKTELANRVAEQNKRIGWLEEQIAGRNAEIRQLMADLKAAEISARLAEAHQRLSNRNDNQAQAIEKYRLLAINLITADQINTPDLARKLIELADMDPGLAPYAGMIKPAAPSATTWPAQWQERINEDAARRAAEILEDDSDEYE